MEFLEENKEYYEGILKKDYSDIVPGSEEYWEKMKELNTLYHIVMVQIKEAIKNHKNGKG